MKWVLGRPYKLLAFWLISKTLPPLGIDILSLFRESPLSGFCDILIARSPSTLENWTREFDKFAPILSVQTYYGSQNDRAGQRVDLQRSQTWEILLTTYNLAQTDVDRRFLSKIDWKVCRTLCSESHQFTVFVRLLYSMRATCLKTSRVNGIRVSSRYPQGGGYF